MKVLIAAFCIVSLGTLPVLAQTSPPAEAAPTRASPGPTTLPAGNPPADTASIPAPPALPPGNAAGSAPAEVSGTGPGGAK